MAAGAVILNFVITFNFGAIAILNFWQYGGYAHYLYLLPT
jgi:hypothetical protein